MIWDIITSIATVLMLIPAFFAVFIYWDSDRKKQRKWTALMSQDISKLEKFLRGDSVTNINSKDYPAARILSRLNEICFFTKNLLEIKESNTFEEFCKKINVNIIVLDEEKSKDFLIQTCQKHQWDSSLKGISLLEKEGFIGIGKNLIKTTVPGLKLIEVYFKNLKDL